MPTLRRLTPEEFDRAADLLLNPRTGSRIEAARNYGIDLTLLVEQLRLSPEERARKLEAASEAKKFAALLADVPDAIRESSSVTL